MKKTKRSTELFGDFGAIEHTFIDREKFLEVCQRAFDLAVDDFNKFLVDNKELLQ